MYTYVYIHIYVYRHTHVCILSIFGKTVDPRFIASHLHWMWISGVGVPNVGGFKCYLGWLGPQLTKQPTSDCFCRILVRIFATFAGKIETICKRRATGCINWPHWLTNLNTTIVNHHWLTHLWSPCWWNGETSNVQTTKIPFLVWTYHSCSNHLKL